MPSKAIVKFGSKEYDVVKYDFSVRRDVDAKGRPSSTLSGGLINMTVESTDDKTIWDSLVAMFKPVDGTITVFKDDEDAKLKEIKWEKGYVVQYQEEGDFLKTENTQQALSSNNLIHFTVSSQKLSVDGSAHENNWPK